MYKKIINSNLVLNSDDELALFQLGNHGDVKYNLYNSSQKLINSSNLYEKKILRYSTAIDKKNRIHLITLKSSGELNHLIYEKGNWSNRTMAKLDPSSNLYGHMNISIIENKINILYSYANLINSNVWTIQHVIDEKLNLEKYNVIRYMSDKISSPFCVDVDSFGTIHLLYSTIENNCSQIYHIFYSSFAKKWNQIPQKLSIQNTDSLYPYLFVDTKDTLHGLWLEKMDLDYTLRYSKLTSKGNERYMWNQVKIPHIPNCRNTPLIFEENGLLKIIYLTNDSIGCLYSLDYGDSWDKGDINKINLSSINFSKVSSNSLNNNDIKINHTYFTTEKKLNFYFVDTFNQISKMSKEITINDINLEESVGEKSENNIKDIIETLEPKLNHLLANQSDMKNILYETLNNQNRIEEKIENISKVINSKKSSLFDRLFDSSK